MTIKHLGDLIIWAGGVADGLPATQLTVDNYGQLVVRRWSTPPVTAP